MIENQKNEQKSNELDMGHSSKTSTLTYNEASEAKEASKSTPLEIGREVWFLQAEEEEKFAVLTSALVGFSLAMIFLFTVVSWFQ